MTDDGALLSCCGLYSGPLSGTWDSATDQADKAFHAQCDKIAAASVMSAS